MKKNRWLLIVVIVLVGVAITAATLNNIQPTHFNNPGYITVFFRW